MTESGLSYSRSAGMMFGMACGDALGTTLEFDERRSLDDLHTEMIGEGPFDLKPGEWTDDTSMAMALGASYVACGGFDPIHVMQEFCTWYKMGRHSVTGKCFDIGNTTRAALDAFLLHPMQLPIIAPTALGNGSIMRLAPAVLIANSLAEAKANSAKQSMLTHGPDAAVIACEMGALLYSGTHADIVRLNHHTDRTKVSSSGFVSNTFQAALWAIATTDSFENAVIQAVNLGDDADSVGAVAGQLAGAIYGIESIPERWMNTIVWKEKIQNMVLSLIRCREVWKS